MKIRDLLERKNLNYKAYAQVSALFLGDSITHGAFEVFKGEHYAIDQFYDHDAVYHNRLRRQLAEVFPNAPLNVVNAGISGSNAVYALERLDRDVFPFSPDLAVVCFGLNDAVAGMDGIGAYSDALGSIFQKLNDRGTETIFMTPNMMNTYVSGQITEDVLLKIAEHTAKTQNSGVMDAYMDAARQVSARWSIPVCDCYAKWKEQYASGADTTQLLSNHINHPTREMHKLFADSLYEMIMNG